MTLPRKGLIPTLLLFISMLFCSTAAANDYTFCLENKTGETFLLGVHINTSPITSTLVGAGQNCTTIKNITPQPNLQLTFLLTHVKRHGGDVNLSFNPECATLNFQPYQRKSPTEPNQVQRIFMWKSKPLPLEEGQAFEFRLEKKSVQQYQLHCKKHK